MLKITTWLYLTCIWGLSGCNVVGSLSPTPLPPLPRRSVIPPGAIKMTPAQDAHPPRLHSNMWKAPLPLDGAVNTAGAEDSPYIVPDDGTLYFFFTPDGSIPPEKQLLDRVTGIYTATLQSGTWQNDTRVLLQEPGKLALDGCEFVLNDVMWFCSAREGFTGVNLFIARQQQGKWGDIQYAGDQLNKVYQVGEMHLSSDEGELYFHSARPGGKGQLDLWVSRKASDGWGTPENLAAVNSPENDGWPWLNQDSSELWFTRTYLGTPAIFRSIRRSGHWSEPELILSQFAGEPTLDRQGNLYFVHHFYKDGKMIEADIYVALRIQ